MRSCERFYVQKCNLVPTARCERSVIWPFDQPGRASEHARTAAPFTGATARCVEHVGRTERLSRRSESRGGRVFEETVGRERTARARAPLSFRPSARGGTRSRSARSAQVTTGTRPADAGRIGAVFQPGSDASPSSASLLIDNRRQVLLSQLSLCVVRRARACRGAAQTPRAVREREGEAGESAFSPRLVSPYLGYTSRQFHAAVRGPFRDFSVSFQSPTAALVAPPGRARGTEQDLRNVNDPSAGSPTETLLRLLLPLNDQVWSSSRQHRQCRRIAAHQSEDLTKSFNR